MAALTRHIGRERDHDAVAWLRDAPAGNNSEFVWLHFDLTDASAQAWMQANLPLNPEFFEALRQGSRSTRIEDAQDNLIAASASASR